MDVSPEHLVEQARERFQLQDYYGAIHLLEEVIATGRAFADAHHLLGLSYSLVGQQDQALAQLDRALQLNPQYVEALIHKAIVLNELGREYEADASLRRAGKLSSEVRQGLPAHVAAKLANQHAALGDAYLEAGALPQAIEQYQTALALGPTFHDLRYKLGRMLLQGGQALEAREQFEIIVRNRPTYLDAAAMLGLACYLAGDGLAAKAVWEDCRETEHGGGVEVRGAVPHDDLELLACFQRLPPLQQHASQLIPQVVERGSERERRLILLDRLRQRARLEIRVAQRRVLVGELRGDVRRQALAQLARQLSGAAQRGVRLVFAAQLVQDDGLVDERFDVLRVQLQRAVELCQGLVLLAHQRVRQAQQVMGVGERAARRDDFLEQVDRAVVVLQLKPLAGLLDEMLRTDVHGSPRTSGRSAGSLPRSRRAAGSRAPPRRGAGRRR